MGRRVGPRQLSRIGEIVEGGRRRPLSAKAKGIHDFLALGTDRGEVGANGLRLAWIAVRVEEPDTRTSAEAIHLAQVPAGVFPMVCALNPLQVGRVEAQRQSGGVVRINDVAGTGAGTKLLEHGARFLRPVGRRRDSDDRPCGHREQGEEGERRERARAAGEARAEVFRARHRRDEQTRRHVQGQPIVQREEPEERREDADHDGHREEDRPGGTLSGERPAAGQAEDTECGHEQDFGEGLGDDVDQEMREELEEAVGYPHRRYGIRPRSGHE